MGINDDKIQNNQKVELLLFQYRECWHDTQYFNALLWQIPSVTTIIAGVLVSISSTALLAVRIVLFIIAFSLTFAMTVAVHKNRFYSVLRLREMAKIEDALTELGINLIAHGSRNSDVIKKEIHDKVLTGMPQGWFYDRIAYNWIRLYMYLLMVALVVGLIVTVI